MPSRTVDVKAQHQQAWHEDLVFIQLGMWTFSLSLGLASEGLKVMRLTACGAFMASAVFSLCTGWRLSGTDIVYEYITMFF